MIADDVNRPGWHRSKLLYVAIAVALITFGASYIHEGYVGASTSVNDVALQQFASQVQTLGQNNYANVFTGAEVSTSGVTIFLINGADGQLESAISAIDTQGFTVTYDYVGESIETLLAEQQSVTNDYSVFEENGVNPVSLWPNAQSASLEMTIEAPTDASMASLSTALSAETSSNSPVTDANYVADAQEFVDQTSDLAVVILPTYENPFSLTAQTRSTDYSPFTGGDPIDNSNYSCTSAFAYKGNASGDEFTLTAGHCGSGKWYTNSVDDTYLGPTSSNYFGDVGDDDFQSILINGSAYGSVWQNETAKHPINGSVTPADGAAITVNGAESGEVTGNVVYASNVNQEYELNGVEYTLSHQILADCSTGDFPCVIIGDSGGPMYQRESGSSSADAVGIINGTGCSTTELPCPQYIVGGELISRILSVANGSLIES